MRILLDNNIPVRFSSMLPGHDVTHVRDRGWQSLVNGELVKAASLEYEVLVSMDQNMPYQTSLKGCSVMVVILVCPSNRLDDMSPISSKLMEELTNLRPSNFITLRGFD